MKDKKDETEVAEVAVEQAPAGRAAILEAYKAANPDTQDDPEDEALFSFAHDRHSRMSEPNAKLAEMVAKDPRAGAMLSMFVGEGKSLPYAMGNVFGRDWLDGDLEEFEAGYQENLKRLTESNAERELAAKNVDEYKATLATFAKDNGLSEDQASQLNDAIFADAENFLMGIISVEYIDYKWKGMNYDKDVEDAASTGFVEGKNEAIDMKKKKVAETPLPDLAGGSGAGKSRKAAPKPARRDIFDSFEASK